MMIEKISNNWQTFKLSQIGEIISGGTPSTSVPEYWNGDVSWITPADLSGYVEKTIAKGRKSITERGLKNSSARIIPKGSVLFSSRAPIGYVAIASKELATNQGFKSIIPNSKVDSEYLYYFLKHAKQKAEEAASGTTFKEISLKKFAELEITLPKIETQRLIVSKIEELFSELDKGVEELKTAQQQLKVYRQTVLKWAFEGRLTNEDVKDGELPEGWKISMLGYHLTNIIAGKSFRCEERPPKTNEVGIIKVSSVTWGFFDEEESKTCFSPDLLNKNFVVKEEDFLFSRANTIELIGACVIVQSVHKTLMLSDKILRFTFTDNILKKYVLYYLRSRQGRREIERLSTGNQDSMRNIGQDKIKQISIPIINIEEQQQVVQEIESRLSVCDKIEETIRESLNQAEALRQSILKRTFEGELVL
jgi:type I restriction enzyme, S subunit